MFTNVLFVRWRCPLPTGLSRKYGVQYQHLYVSWCSWMQRSHDDTVPKFHLSVARWFLSLPRYLHQVLPMYRWKTLHLFLPIVSLLQSCHQSVRLARKRSQLYQTWFLSECDFQRNWNDRKPEVYLPETWWTLRRSYKLQSLFHLHWRSTCLQYLPRGFILWRSQQPLQLSRISQLWRDSNDTSNQITNPNVPLTHERMKQISTYEQWILGK